LPASATARDRAQFDWIGTLLLCASLGAYALIATTGISLSLSTIALAILMLLALTAFLLVESRTAQPLVRLDLLRDPRLTMPLLAMGLVSAIVMTTLVVGPFFLSRTLGLGVGATGLVMSVGPVVAALVGAPSGRLVDRAGAATVSRIGLVGVMLGSMLMMVLPGVLAVIGYTLALATITAGYALFQAANTTIVMAGLPPDRRGVVSGLLGLSRNIGLITGAAAMGSLFAAIAVSGLGPIPPGGAAGLVATFAVATGLAALSLILVWAPR